MSRTLLLALAFASALSPVTAGVAAADPVADPLVRWQLAARDVVHAVRARLADWAEIAERSGLRIPDLTVLTTEPLPNTQSSGFGWRNDPFRHRAKFHSGADFRGKPGTPVLAAGAGVVAFTGRRGGYGNVVDIDHGGGVITRYAHLRRILIKPRAAIAAGQPLGQVGATGRVTGPHLHFEVRLDGRPVDPTTALAVAQLARESDAAARIAAFALAADVQSAHASRIDPPRERARAKAKRAGEPAKRPGRPERSGRPARVRPVS